MSKIKVKFPDNNGHKYYKWHAHYIYNVLIHSGLCDVELVDPEGWFFAPATFNVEIDNKPVLFCLQDHNDLTVHENIENAPGTVILRNYLEDIDNVYPMGPMMGLVQTDPRLYNILINHEVPSPVEYESEYFYNQRAYGAAVERRSKMHALLKTEFVEYEPLEYWTKSLASRYNPLLPGANLYVFDRALAELLYLGATVMHPKIDVVFPYYKKLVAGEHYIEIKHDGSDCLEKMDGTQTGKAAKEFMKCAHPTNLVKWWLEVI